MIFLVRETLVDLRLRERRQADRQRGCQPSRRSAEDRDIVQSNPSRANSSPLLTAIRQHQAQPTQKSSLTCDRRRQLRPDVFIWFSMVPAKFPQSLLAAAVR